MYEEEFICQHYKSHPKFSKELQNFKNCLVESDKITHLLSDDLYDFVSFLEFYIGHCLNNEETPDSNAFEELLEKIEILASSMVELTEKLKLDQIKPPGIKSKITKAMDENGFTRFLKDSTNLCIGQNLSSIK